MTSERTSRRSDPARGRLAHTSVPGRQLLDGHASLSHDPLVERVRTRGRRARWFVGELALACLLGGAATLGGCTGPGLEPPGKGGSSGPAFDNGESGAGRGGTGGTGGASGASGVGGGGGAGGSAASAGSSGITDPGAPADGGVADAGPLDEDAGSD